MRTLLAVILLLSFGLNASAQSAAADSARLKLLLKAGHSDSARGDYRSALKHLSQYRRLKDSVLAYSKQGQIAQLQQQYQTAKKDGEIRSGEKNINLLTAQNRLINLNLQQTRSNRNIIILVTGIAALLLLATYLQYRLKLGANRRLQLQQNAIGQKNDLLLQMAGQKDSLLGEKELLIKEIHHRVKNNLQVVISLLNTQSAYLHDAQASAAIRQSQYRMQSISLIHQKLYQSESRALINIKEYTQELVQYLQQSFDTGSRIIFKLDIDDIDLDVSRAVPLGLILNETITNAIKYAFPAESNRCSIDIKLHYVDGQSFKLCVADNGCGLPAEFGMDICQSLGFNLIKGMCRQISGQLAIENKNGLAIVVEFPADAVLAGQAPNDDIPSFGGEENSH